MLECARIRRMDACACVLSGELKFQFFSDGLQKGERNWFHTGEKNAFWYEMGRLLGAYAIQ